LTTRIVGQSRHMEALAEPIYPERSMIQRLTISRFKSVRDLAIDCRKVNVLIGAPDTGKTNILDALQLLSRLGFGWPIDTSLRISPQHGFDTLFYRQFFDQPFRIGFDDHELSAQRQGPNGLQFQIRRIGVDFKIDFGGSRQLQELDWVRFYSYRGPEEWHYRSDYHRGTEIVTTPHGWNLTYIARHNEKVYDLLKETVRETGGALDWRLRFDPVTKQFGLSEVRQDDILDYNLELLSDSVKRFFFYAAILATTSEATLVLDEPDVYAFPPYPKLLGEMIAEDTTNQFFLTTHNPYFLAALAEKTPASDLAIFVCYRDAEGGTQARLLDSEQVAEIIERGASVFFDLARFTGESP
jgi:hypothetical protein